MKQLTHTLSRWAMTLALGVVCVGVQATDFTSGGLKYTTLTGSNVALAGFASGGATASVTVPGNVTYEGTTYTVAEVGADAFKNNTTLQQMVLPEGLTKLGANSFLGASKLNSLALPTTLQEIGDNAFESTSSLKTLELPQGLTKLGARAFRYAGVTSIVIPGTVTKMGTDIFFGNTSLVYIKYGEGIKTIPMSFRGSVALEEIDLPSTLQSVEYFAFAASSKIKQVTCRAINPPTCEDQAFGSGDMSKVLLVVPPQSLQAYMDASTWKGFKVVPNQAGTEFTMDGIKYKVTSLTTAEVSGFASNAMADVTLPPEAIYNKVSYEVTNIADNAFANQTGLSKVQLPYSLATVGSAAFKGCTGLTNVLCAADIPPVCQANSFEGVNLTTCKLTVAPECIDAYKGAAVWKEFTNIEGGAFAAKDFTAGGFNYTSLTESTAAVTGKASNNTATTITIPAEVTYHGVTYKVLEVGPKAFNGTSLSKVTISEGITTLRSNAFYGCSMSSVVLPQSLTLMEDRVFSWCRNLNNVVIPDQITELAEDLFYVTDKLTNITLPPNLKVLGNSTFGSSGLRNIVIPASVESLGGHCFVNCDYLARVVCNAVKPPKDEGGCFTNCPLATARLIVPEQSVEDYKVASGWKGFGFILPNTQDTEGLMIKELSTVPVVALDQAFDLNFVLVNNEMDKIQSLTYALSFNGQEKTVDLTIDPAYAADPVKSVNLKLPFDAISTQGQYPGTLTITKINGKDNGATTRSINFFVVASNGTTLPENAIAYTYSNEPLKSYLGLMKPADLWQAALKLQDPALTGLKVVGFKARGLREDNYNEYGWLSTKLQRSPDVAIMTGTRDAKELTVAFVEPYTITDEGIYVGYTFQSDNTYPLPYCEPTNIPNSLFASYSGLAFEDYSETGCLPMTVYLMGELGENSLALQPYTGSELGVKGQIYELTFDVSNGGTNAIKNVGYTYTLNGQTIEGSADVDIEAALGAGGKFSLEVAPIAEPGEYPMELTLNTVNGKINANPAKSAKLTLRNMHFKPTHRPLMEEGTGTWCQWCPGGWKAMELMNEKYPEFVGVAWHNKDPMAITTDYPVPYTAFPQAFIDRASKSMDPFTGEAGTDFGIYDTYASYAAKLTVADMNLTSAWNADSTALSVSATAYFATPCKGYKIGYILGENGYYHPDEKPWFQANAYSGASGYTGYLEELTKLPNPIEDITFNDVVISAAAARGLAQSLPAEAEALKEYSFPYTFATESIKGIYPAGDEYELIENRDKMFVVALIIAPDGTIANSCKVKAGENFNGVVSVGSLSEDATSDAAYYDLMGRRVLNPGTGMYIRVQNGQATKVIR